MRDWNWKSELAIMFINLFIFNTLHGLNSLSIFASIMYKKILTSLGEQTLPHFPGKLLITVLSAAISSLNKYNKT